VFGSLETGRGGMVPVSPRGLRAESCEGPQPGRGLPAGSQPGIATADVYRSSEENNLVRSIVDRYLGSNESGAAGPSNISSGGNVNEDAMSVSSIITGSTSLKRTRKSQEDVSDFDVEDRSHRSHKVFRSRVIDSDSDSNKPEIGPIVLSDSPENVEKVRRRKARAQRREVIMAPPADLDLSADLANLVFTNCPSRLMLEDVALKDAEELAGISSGWLDDMELVGLSPNE